MASHLLVVSGCRILTPPGSPLRKALAPVRSALASKDLGHALREMDRAWRQYPTLRHELAHPYARLLMRQGWDWAAAASLLHGVARGASPDLHADLIHALRRSGQRAAATKALDDALKRFAMNPALAREARACLADDGAGFGGWTAITPTFRLHAEG